MNRVMAAIVAFIVWTLLAFAAGWAWRGDRAEGADATTKRDAAQAETKAVQGARATEQASAETLADIGTQHEEDRRDAETVPAAVAADLRDGNLRLRREWQGCETQRLSDASSAVAAAEQYARDREDGAGRLVRAAKQCDAQVIGLQDAYNGAKARLDKHNQDSSQR